MKDTKIKEILQDGKFFIFDEKHPVVRFLPEKTKVFGSNTAPVKLCFETSLGKSLDIMYKYSDDLRQDQLIMQLISLMDYLLKGVNVDLRLTIYSILTFSPIDGIIEFVQNSTTIQNALTKDLDGYLIQLSKKKNDLLMEINPKMAGETPPLNEIREDIYENYKESCASYCVITYLLGIGDRHLENIMIDKEGKFFHIDFGYTMGEDPKPRPPPFKLTPAMISSKLTSLQRKRTQRFHFEMCHLLPETENASQIHTEPNDFHDRLESHHKPEARQKIESREYHDDVREVHAPQRRH